MHRRTHTITLSAALAVTAGSAAADTVTRSGFVKAGAQFPFTSWIVETPSRDCLVSAPGWNATRAAPGSSTWHLTGGSTAPGGTFTASITNPGGGVGATARVTRGDYNDSNGVNHLVSSCGDPIGQNVVFGGATGTTYLGYQIPANQYGYFHQQWQPAGAEATLLSSSMNIGASSQAHNFQVIQNSFPIAPVSGFDMGDMDVPFRIQSEAVPYEMTTYMHPADATSLPGVATMWSFNPVSGIATMDFTGAGGLAPGQTGSIVAYTSPLAPDVPAADNLSYIFQETPVFGCPEYDLRINTVMIPGVPAPGPAAVIGLSALLTAGRRRSRPHGPSSSARYS